MYVYLLQVSSPDVDAVFVLTNMESHLEYATMAIEQGKHVLVEKPVGSTVILNRLLTTLTHVAIRVHIHV